MTIAVQFAEEFYKRVGSYLNNMWDWLTEPASAIVLPEQRQRARLLSMLLLVSTPLIALGSTFSIGSTLIAIIALLIAYGLSRTRYYRAAIYVSLAVFTVPFGAALASMTDHNSAAIFSAIVWLTLPLLLSILLLSYREIALVVTLLFLCIALLTLLMPELAFSAIVGPLGYIGVTFVMVMLVATIRRPYIRQLNEQLGQLQDAQEHLQAARNELEERIVDQDRQTDQLEHVNERMAAILRSSSDAIILAGPSGDIQQTNQAFDIGFGYDVDETFGWHLTRMVEPENVEGFTQVLQAVEKERRSSRLEIRARRKDGTSFEADASISPITDRKNEMWGIICSLRDITERKRAEELLRKKEQRYRALFDQTHDAVFILDLEGNHKAANRVAANMLGYSEDEILGLSVMDIVASSQLSNSMEALARLRSGQTIPLYERLFRKKNGEEFPVEINVEMVRDTNGNPMHIQSVVRDITERKRTEAMLRDALEREKELGELKTRFVSVASHEFRTPLATIQATADVLQYYFHKMTPEDIEGRFRKIQSQIKHMTTLMDDVLVLGRMQGGKIELNPEDIALDVFCREILDEFQTIHKNTHQFLYRPDVDNPHIDGDPKLLRRLLSNLLSNGAKYSPEGSSVTLTLRQDANNILLVVQDNGIGIPESDQPHMFETFHRATNTNNIAGTGLGLVIAKQAVDLHGGSITFESTVGVGTTFTVTLPIERNGD